MEDCNSIALLKNIYTCWKIAGVTRDPIKSKIWFIAYSAVVQITVTFYYPFHLQMGLFSFDTIGENIQNLSLYLTCMMCSFKFIINAWNKKKFHFLESLVEKLDKRIKTADEREEFVRMGYRSKSILYAFLGLYCVIGLSASAVFILNQEWVLLYPAWFPFDWHKNFMKYVAANLYQIIGIFYQLTQNYGNDSFPGVSLCLLSGHINMLAIRVSKIGHKNENVLENEQELLRCIQDQKTLYDVFDAIQQLISIPMLMQLTVSVANICVAVVALMFYADKPADMIYYAMYTIAMFLQVFPVCYYGSEVQRSFENLHYAIFSSNWVPQTRTYKKNMIIFTERSLKQTIAFAAGMIRIHLDTFFATCKGAYSMFAVIKQMN